MSQQQEQPPSGTCAYQVKLNDWLWRCYSEVEYAQKKHNELIAQEQCIATRPMPNYPELTDFLRVCIIFSFIWIFYYCVETQNWWRWLLTLLFLLFIFIFLKPFC